MQRPQTPLKNHPFKSQMIKSSSGANLNLYTTRAEVDPKAVIQISHGMSEHAARYERFANALASNGYHTIAHDHRGHGKTTAPDAPIGQFATQDGWNKVLADVDAVNGYARKTFPDLPVCAFGHSMGATIAASYVLNYPLRADAAAIWNGSMTGFLPNLLVQVLKIERMLKGSDVVSTWGDVLTFQAWNKAFKPNRTQSDWLSRDPDEVDKYVADPLCGFSVNIGLWLDLLGGLNDLSDMDKINSIRKDMPFHVLGGAVDPCSSHSKAVNQLGDRLLSAGLTDITKIVLPETRHESLNEVNRDETTAQFIKWLDERFSK
ncbi:MAG: alpha/beta fold hydrolase [Rhizobiaceae bacterium]